GAYYMISRSLGPEFGGAIGIIFSVANAVAVAMYVVGFAESVRNILVDQDCVMTDETNDMRIIGSITITVLLGIAIVGMDWEARAQVVLLVILTLAILNFFVGLCIPPSAKQMSRGFLGPKAAFEDNLFSDYEDGYNFFKVFAVYFPAATGILAGANISGDLKDASKSIPKGTFLAIFITTFVYLLIAVFSGMFVLRYANGIILESATATNVTDIVNNSTGQFLTSLLSTSTVINTNKDSILVNTSYLVKPTAPTLEKVFTLEEYSYSREFVSNCSLIPEGCKYGLIPSKQVVEMAAAWGPLILAGIFSATLSSALASLMSAPKVFQALCKDKIFPFLGYFGVGYGANDNPRRAFILCFVIGFAFQLMADLDRIAPLISNFFLMSYALINFSCFDASIANSPGWRPSFRFYSKWLSLGGALLCVGVMFIIEWYTALITFGCVAAMFLYVHHRKPDVNWGSSTQAHVYRSLLQSALKLVRIGTHVKNFRPQVLVLSGEPEARPTLVDFCTHITKKMGLMVCGNVIIGKQGDNLRKILSDAPYQYFFRRHIRSFYSVATASTFQLGAQALMQNVGIGKFRPNLLILGFKSNWQVDNPENVQQYLEVIHDAFDLRLGVGILRVKEGFGLDIETNLSMFHQDPEEDQSDDETPQGSPSEVAGNQDESTAAKQQSNGQSVEVEESSRTHDHEDELGRGDGPDPLINPLLLAKLNTQVLKTMNIFRNKEKGTIDVWWLFDDGGLTLLLPYILTTKPYWRNCRLRVFAAGTRRGDLGYEQRQLATLLAKFRIDCKDMTVLPEINKKPSEESVRLFNSYLANWKLDPHKGETKTKFPWKTTDDELELLKEKTQRQIRLRELLLERSKDAALIVMTLPMPRKSTCPAGLYMCWIDTLTRDMPPILLVRGNQESVLTFYS
ncbi:solute carrier family 12 member 2, partial [Biomphalaria pfeifferi]